ncbi:hypothetical protein IGI04_025660 [Brassica rapa subsp. trilocularis]|uniref:Uncharacterized protein n=1 Tax=Brassica rapa subsp. trilocularis TaxID=1813537 RepID=A0ABQ7KXN0_BRACM|nr:hypothetical protein IGI04_025660 [Brassica rapa subsp. trilocularis]
MRVRDRQQHTTRPPPPLAVSHGEERGAGKREREERKRQREERESTARASCLWGFPAELRFKVSDERREGVEACIDNKEG